MIATRMIGESHPSTYEEMPAGRFCLNVKNLLGTRHSPSGCTNMVLFMDIMLNFDKDTILFGFEWFFLLCG